MDRHRPLTINMVVPYFLHWGYFGEWAQLCPNGSIFRLTVVSVVTTKQRYEDYIQEQLKALVTQFGYLQRKIINIKRYCHPLWRCIGAREIYRKCSEGSYVKDNDRLEGLIREIFKEIANFLKSCTRYYQEYRRVILCHIFFVILMTKENMVYHGGSTHLRNQIQVWMLSATLYRKPKWKCQTCCRFEIFFTNRPLSDYFTGPRMHGKQDVIRSTSRHKTRKHSSTRLIICT